MPRRQEERKSMTNKELKKLTRLQLLVEQGKEMERLKRRAERAEEKLRKRMLLLSEAGSIAEAALRLNGVFEAAQAAADQYLDSVRAMHGVAVEREEGYDWEAPGEDPEEWSEETEPEELEDGEDLEKEMKTEKGLKEKAEPGEEPEEEPGEE